MLDCDQEASMKQKTIDLRARRQELNLTLEDVATIAGRSSAMIRSIEVGGQRGSLVTRAKIADALKIPLSSLMSSAETNDLAGLEDVLRLDRFRKEGGKAK